MSLALRIGHYRTSREVFSQDTDPDRLGRRPFQRLS